MATQHLAVEAIEKPRHEINRSSLIAAFGIWIGFLLGVNALVSSTNSNFLAALPDALGASRTAVSGALASSVWLVAVLLPISGRIMDRYGVRAVILPGAVLFGAVYLAMSQMHALWHYYALQALLAVAVAMYGSLGFAKLISLWFDRHRGLMLGLCVAFGAGLGQTIMPQVSRWMIDSYGWRGGYVGIALIVLILAFPLLFIFARPPGPSQESLEFAPGEAPKIVERIGLLPSEAIRTPTFYLIVAAIMLGSLSLIATLQHAVPMLLERGFDKGLATTAMSCAFFGVIIGEFTTGFLVDRLNTPKIIIPYFVAALGGLLVVHSTTNASLLLPGAVFMGMGMGCEVGLNAYLISRYFGLKSFGALYGMSSAASNFGIGLGVLAMGYIRDHFGSYHNTVYLVGCTMSLSLLCVLFLGPFRYSRSSKA